MDNLTAAHNVNHDDPPAGALLQQIVLRMKSSLGTYAQPCAEHLLMHALGCSRTQLYTDIIRNIDTNTRQHIDAMVQRCICHEPPGYVTGSAYFYDREFVVSPAILLPRPDTEVLVETVLRNEQGTTAFFADLGTGSGIISCILTEKNTGWEAVAIDCSVDALSIARNNFRNNRIYPLCCNRLSALPSNNQFEFIVSNPPYIPSADIEKLEPSVRNFEPHLALDGGEDGLHFYRYLATEAPRYLKKGGSLYCEIGFNQEDQIREIFSTPAWECLDCTRDLAGHPRVISIKKRNRA